MFEKDYEIIYQALNMWANYIETKNINLSAIDAKDIINSIKKEGEVFPKRIKPKIMGLDSNQMKLIIRIRELADKTFNERIK